ncbi:hypothetical protein OM416_26215 [Paenibacillus sp. LS1]|uniref:hypothetical protein n=1 Tax=Paenibacillus sp. LS1 TaxID=2992120 RepID=UPI00222F306A|nr:hypothetical protein [Paenibacillus sp. LS1]MCW3795101.1 hypothetical protein [Paenibacillus sp. LS1]
MRRLEVKIIQVRKQADKQVQSYRRKYREGTQQFMKLAELTSEMVHRFIDKLKYRRTER